MGDDDNMSSVSDAYVIDNKSVSKDILPKILVPLKTSDSVGYIVPLTIIPNDNITVHTIASIVAETSTVTQSVAAEKGKQTVVEVCTKRKRVEETIIAPSEPAARTDVWSAISSGRTCYF